METVIASSEYAKPLDIFSDVKLVSQLSSWAQAQKIGRRTHTQGVRVCAFAVINDGRTASVQFVKEQLQHAQFEALNVRLAA